MKETTVHSLVIARALLEKAAPLCTSNDRYLASAGLVILQDALEMVFYALLIENGIDEVKNVESKSFDELIGELRKAGVGVPKSGTLKALNKQRVLTKHYAQVAEPATVGNYYDAALLAIEQSVASVTGKSLTEFFLADLLQESKARGFLENAEGLIHSGDFLDALIEIRKALFLEFEQPYSVFGWRDVERPESADSLATLIRGGWKAPYWTKNKKWIDENLQHPIDYIQIDYERWRLDAMEWGINTAELQNLRRLTPEVFRSDEKGAWSVKYDADFPANEATSQNAIYCLDKTIGVILKKQEHERTSRSRRRDQPFVPPPIYIGENLYKSASESSDVVHVISDDFEYTVHAVTSGFEPAKRFLRISGFSKEKTDKELPKDWASGFLLIRDEAGK